MTCPAKCPRCGNACVRGADHTERHECLDCRGAMSTEAATTSGALVAPDMLACQELFAAARQVVRAWRGPASELSTAMVRLGHAVGLDL